MGLSHYSIINAHPDAKVVALCDSFGYLLDILNKYQGVPVFKDYEAMLDEAKPHAVIIATPSPLHASMVRIALARGLHVFCEKPFCISANESADLAALVAGTGLTNQVGYHNRFVGTFRETKRLLDAGAIGTPSHVLAEAYGPVVLRAKRFGWRTSRKEGGGCLFDYAAHPINLVTWYFGAPNAVGGTVLNKIFSKDGEDEVYSTLHFPIGVSAQLSTNWSDNSYRKMTTKITIWGTNGRIYADRQEIQVYLRSKVTALQEYNEGWNVRYATELAEKVWFYVRGEEYSAQLDHFVQSIKSKTPEHENSFGSAAETDRVIAMIIADASTATLQHLATHNPQRTAAGKLSFFRR